MASDCNISYAVEVALKAEQCRCLCPFNIHFKQINSIYLVRFNEVIEGNGWNANKGIIIRK